MKASTKFELSSAFRAGSVPLVEGSWVDTSGCGGAVVPDCAMMPPRPRQGRQCPRLRTAQMPTVRAGAGVSKGGRKGGLNWSVERNRLSRDDPRLPALLTARCHAASELPTNVRFGSKADAQPMSAMGGGQSLGSIVNISSRNLRGWRDFLSASATTGGTHAGYRCFTRRPSARRLPGRCTKYSADLERHGDYDPDDENHYPDTRP